MTSDEKASLGVMGVAGVALLGVLAIATWVAPVRPPDVVIAPTTTSTLERGVTCIDASGFPVHTDRPSAQRTNLTCPPKGTHP